MKLIRKNRILILILLILECHTFNQTKRLSKIVDGETEVEAKNINKVTIDNDNNIQIYAEIRKARTNIILGEQCLNVYYDYTTKNYKLNYLDGEKISFNNTCEENFKKELSFKFIKTPNYRQIESFEHNYNKKKMEAIFINLNNRLLIIELGVNNNENRQNKISARQLINKMPKENYQYFYPLSISYDLIAGTIHTISKPIYYSCRASIGLMYGGSYSKNYWFFIGLPFFIATCPPTYILLYPDCYTDPKRCNIPNL